MKRSHSIALCFFVISLNFNNLFGQTISCPWPWTISSDFGPRLLSGWDFHEGIDYNAAYQDEDLGTPIPAVEGGNIVAIASRGSFYNINVKGDSTGDVWLYGHIFRNNTLTVTEKNSSKIWELRLKSELVNPINQSDTRQGSVIILWSGTRAEKILVSVEPFNNAGRWVRNPDGSCILAVDGSTATTQGSVGTGESVAPMGDAAATNVHLHLGLNYPDDNPLLHLKHSPDYSPSITIETPANNHLFTEQELSTNYQINVKVDSTRGLDLDKVSLFVYRNNDPAQSVALGDTPTFSYGGRTGESKSATVKETSGGPTGVQPLDANTATSTIDPGLDRFIFWQNFSSLNLPDGVHSFVVKAKDVNNHEVEISRRFVIDRTPPPAVPGGSGDQTVPIVKITSPESGAQPTSADLITVSGTASDDFQVNEIKVNGQYVYIDPGTSVDWSIDLDLEEGVNIPVVAVAIDQAGNAAHDTIYLTVDKTSPTVTLTGADDEGIYKQDVTLTAKAEDNLDPAPKIQGDITGVNEVFQTYTEEGAHAVSVYAEDWAGLKSEKQEIKFTIDKTPPQASGASPSDGTDISGETSPVSVDISCGLSDALSGVDVSSIKVYLNNQDITSQCNIDESGISSTRSLGYGEQRVRVEASDRAGNAMEAYEWSFGVCPVIKVGMVSARSWMYGSWRQYTRESFSVMTDWGKRFGPGYIESGPSPWHPQWGGGAGLEIGGLCKYSPSVGLGISKATGRSAAYGSGIAYPWGAISISVTAINKFGNSLWSGGGSCSFDGQPDGSIKIEPDKAIDIEGGLAALGYTPSDVKALKVSLHSSCSGSQATLAASFSGISLSDYFPMDKTSTAYGEGIGSGSNYFIANTSAGRIDEYDEAGTLVRSIGEGVLTAPEDATIEHNAAGEVSRIFVADTGRVAIFEADGSYAGEIAGLVSPGSMVIKAGKLYLAESGSAKIKVYDMAGNKLAELTGGFNNPRGIDVDDEGNIYIADTGNNRIAVMSEEGALLKTFGTSGSGDGEFNAPEGVAVDDYGTLYVADTGNDRIQIFDAGGEFQGKIGDFKVGPAQFKTPTDIGMSREGVLYIMDSGRNLLHQCRMVEPFLYEPLEEIVTLMTNVKSADILDAEECDEKSIEGRVKGSGIEGYDLYYGRGADKDGVDEWFRIGGGTMTSEINLTDLFLLHRIAV